MAVATLREYGLFIDGAVVEPASGELRKLPIRIEDLIGGQNQV